jgi:hypothetical protein
MKLKASFKNRQGMKGLKTGGKKTEDRRREKDKQGMRILRAKHL